MNSMSFPELNDLLAKYGLKNEEFAEVLGIDAVSFEKKINCREDFSLVELWNIRNFFSDLENISMEGLFFAWKIHDCEIGLAKELKT